MITLEPGLVNSFFVLEYLRNNEELKDIPINVGAFTNCRECGLTFRISGKKSFTWCIYEHRNSDEIIINGKEGYLSITEDLPYGGGTKWDYISCFTYNQHYEASKKLADLIIEFWEKNKDK